MTEQGVQFLKELYPQMAKDDEEVQMAFRIEQSGNKQGNKVPAEKKIQAFLSWMEKRVDVEDPAQKERNVARLSRLFVEKQLIEAGNIPNAYFTKHMEIGRQMGLGTYELTDTIKANEAERIRDDQRETLGIWVRYLAQNEGHYPMWFRYYVLRSVSKLQAFDKETESFRKRDKTTTKPYPVLNAEALAYVYNDLLLRVNALDTENEAAQNQWQAFKAANPERAQLLEGGAFNKLYADSLQKLEQLTLEKQKGKEATIEGDWIQFSKGSEGQILAQKLQGHNTGWCIAGTATAENYLEDSDVYIYFTLDENQGLNVPRAAIVVNALGVTEVRGILPRQNLEPILADKVSAKLQKLPQGSRYYKKVEHMRKLTAFEERTKNGESLSAAELRFLYQLDEEIEGFGWEPDPRIEVLQQQEIGKDATTQMLLEASKDTNPAVQQAAIQKMGRRPEQFVAALTALAENEQDEQYGLKIKAIISMSDRPELFVDILVKCSQDEDQTVRLRSLLAMLAHPELFTSAIMARATDEDENVRTIAIRLMETHISQFADTLISVALNDPTTNVRLQAIRLMSNGKSQSLFVETLATLAQDPNQFVHKEALDIIARQPNVHTAILRTLAQDKTAPMHNRAIRAMQGYPTHFQNTLETLAQDEDETTRLMAVESMNGSFQYYQDTLRKLSQDSSPKVLWAVIQNMGQNPLYFVPELTRFAQSEDQLLRLTAVMSIAKSPGRFSEVLTATAQDSVDSVRSQTAKAMSNQPELFIVQIKKLAEDQNEIIRSQAQTIIQAHPDLFRETA